MKTSDFTLKLNLDNAAFADDPEREIRLCFEKAMVELDFNRKEYRKIRDSNGNTVGQYRIRWNVYD